MLCTVGSCYKEEKNMRLKKSKKLAGDANMISALIAVIPVMALVILSVMLFAQISLKQRAEWSLRQFMLSMEVDGCLTPDNRVLLMNKLDSLGAYDISLDGTTLSKRDYGDEIILSVKGKIRSPIISSIGDWIFKVEDGYYDFSFRKESTFLGGS